MRPPPLTHTAQQRVAAHLCDGSLAVDATVGNGHDTVFLARQVGPSGHVWGFDVQAQALARARASLAEHGLERRVTLLQRGHQELQATLPATARGQLAAVMFNLGYLPGGDKQLTTLPDTTLTALRAAIEELAPNGILSVLAYRGHPGGQAEAAAVAALLHRQARAGFHLETLESPGPVLYLLSGDGARPANHET